MSPGMFRLCAREMQQDQVAADEGLDSALCPFRRFARNPSSASPNPSTTPHAPCCSGVPLPAASAVANLIHLLEPAVRVPLQVESASSVLNRFTAAAAIEASKLPDMRESPNKYGWDLPDTVTAHDGTEFGG